MQIRKPRPRQVSYEFMCTAAKFKGKYGKQQELQEVKLRNTTVGEELPVDYGDESTG